MREGRREGGEEAEKKRKEIDKTKQKNIENCPGNEAKRKAPEI